MIDHDVTTSDGRALKVTEGGDSGGVPVLCHHGTPGGRTLEPGALAAAQHQGIRLIGYDRPGYGGSDRHEGRNVADCAADVRAIAGALGVRTLGVWGISGGGPHAAACAGLLTGLVPAVGVVASVAPWRAPGLDYFAGMGEDNVQDTELYLSDRTASRAKCETDRQEMLGADLDAMTESMRSLLAPVDAAQLTGELGAFMLDSTKSALATSADGWWDDGVAHMSDWGFGLTQITTPVLVMHGRHDQFVPFAHGEWLAANIPGAEAALYDDEGHLSLLINHIEELNDWLLERMR